MTLADLLQTVRRVEVRTNRFANDMMVGAYLSRFRGRGMDFEELREYTPGDDVRDIDWNTTYRHGRVFVKRFREERELPMILALDVSGSNDFGSVRRSKREFATEIAATLAFSAARNGDKVGLLLFTEHVELYLPPRKGRRNILRIIREILQCRPKRPGTNIPAALGFLNQVLHRRSILFLLTDFLHSFGAGARLAGTGRDLVQEIGLTNARHDLVCVHLNDPRETQVPPAGLLTVEDAESGELLELDTARDAVRRNYARINAERVEELDRILRQAGVDTMRVNTDEDFAPVLQRFFETRRGRRRG